MIPRMDGCSRVPQRTRPGPVALTGRIGRSAGGRCTLFIFSVRLRLLSRQSAINVINPWTIRQLRPCENTAVVHERVHWQAHWRALPCLVYFCGARSSRSRHHGRKRKEKGIDKNAIKTIDVEARAKVKMWWLRGRTIIEFTLTNITGLFLNGEMEGTSRRATINIVRYFLSLVFALQCLLLKKASRRHSLM